MIVSVKTCFKQQYLNQSMEFHQIPEERCFIKLFNDFNCRLNSGCPGNRQEKLFKPCQKLLAQGYSNYFDPLNNMAAMGQTGFPFSYIGKMYLLH